MTNWFARKRAPKPAPVRVDPALPKRAPMPRFRVSGEDAPPVDIREVLKAYAPPPGVRGTGAVAMDSALAPTTDWAAEGGAVLSGVIRDGLCFMGYPQLAAMMLRAEFLKPIDTIAKEATREWIKFNSTKDTEDKAADNRTAELQTEFRRLRIRDVVRRHIRHQLAFGLGHIWPDFGVPMTTETQNVPLVIGPKGVAKGSLKGFRNIEPIWTTPNQYNADNPLRADYFKPRNWWVQGTLVDASRLFTSVPFEVPDILKPAFNFGGLSLSQQLQAYVHNFLRTRQSVSDLVSNFATKVLKTDMAGNMADPDAGMNYGDIDAASLTGRVAAMNAYQSNHGTFVIDKTNEDFTVVATPLSGLDALQSQSQEFMASIPGIPLVKLFGLQPSGLNASSDGEIRVFYDEIAAFQEANVAPVLRRIFELVQLNLWGEIDPDLDFEFVHLWQMDEEQAARIEKIKADTDAVNVQAGKISEEEAREREAKDPQSFYREVNLSGPPPERPEDDVGDPGLEDLMNKATSSEEG